MARATIGLNRTSCQDRRPPCWRSTKRGSAETEMMIIGISRMLLRRPQPCVIAAGDNISPSTTAMAQRMKRIFSSLFMPPYRHVAVKHCKRSTAIPWHNPPLQKFPKKLYVRFTSHWVDLRAHSLIGHRVLQVLAG